VGKALEEVEAVSSRLALTSVESEVRFARKRGEEGDERERRR
jgi:hypothetical protein